MTWLYVICCSLYIKRFYLAGNPQDEFSQQQGQRYQQGRQQQQQGRQQQQPGRQQQQQGQGQQGRRGQQQQGRNSKNLFAGFDTQMLAQALNVDEEIVNRLQGWNDDRNEIVQVQGQLDFVSPFSQGEQEGRRQMGGGGRANGLEETFCSMRLKENIRDPSRADFYSPQAGRVSVVNSGTLPILRALRLSAEHGVLYNVSDVRRWYTRFLINNLLRILERGYEFRKNKNCYMYEVQKKNILLITVYRKKKKRLYKDNIYVMY